LARARNGEICKRRKGEGEYRKIFLGANSYMGVARRDQNLRSNPSPTEASSEITTNINH
jgi:hypothetical protein